MKKLLVVVFAALTLALGPGMAFAVPSVQQIEAAMSQGNWQQADDGLTQVLQAHPDNAHAHYLYAQVLDREGRFADALSQVQQAKTLDPQTRFTEPSHFAQTEARLRRDAARAEAATSNSATPPAQIQTGNAPGQFMQLGTSASRHGPGMGMWIGLLFVIGAVALVLRWSLRRARSNGDAQTDDERRAQLKRATGLLNAVRSLKLDVRLSTVPGHEALEKEVEATESDARALVEALSDNRNPVAPYQIDNLERQIESLKARSEGRPDPYAGAANASGGSPFAREADERFGRQPPYPYSPQQQPPVVVQQGGGLGGMLGGGVGGLLTGVLLGEALSGGRERVVERDVIVDDETQRRDDGGGLDFGQGSNDWNDGGGIDMGSNDDSGGGWSDT